MKGDLVEGCKWVEGYDGRYCVNEGAEIYSCLKDEPKLMKGAHIYNRKRNRVTYKVVLLLDSDGVSSTKYRHRLVAQAFIPNPEGKKEVNHKDGDKLNNALSNLEWATRSENTIHAYDNGLIGSTSRGLNNLSKEQLAMVLDGYINYGMGSRYCQDYSEGVYRKKLTKEDFERNGVPYDLYFKSLQKGTSYRDLWLRTLVIYTCLRIDYPLRLLSKKVGLHKTTLCQFRTTRKHCELEQIYEKYLNDPKYIDKHVWQIMKVYNSTF